MAESLQQAIGLEKLPEVSNIINRDTIFIEVYDLISGPDSLPDEVVTRMLPRHIDRWPIKSNINNDLKKEMKISII